MNKKVKYAIRILLGVAILFFLLRFIGFGSIRDAFQDISYHFLLPGILIAVAFFFFEAFNVAIIAWTIRKIPYARMLRYYLLTWSFNLFIPANLAYISMVYFLKKEGIPIGPATVVVLVDKFTTFVALFAISLFGLGLFFTSTQAAAIILVAVAFVLVAAFLFVSSPGRSLLRRIPFSRRFAGFYSTLSSFPRRHMLPLLLNTFITVIKWLSVALMIKLFFLAVNTDVPYHLVLVITCMVVLLSYIPVSIAGLGIRETSAAFFYSQLGISASAAVAVYIINLVLNYIMAVIILVALSGELGKE